MQVQHVCANSCLDTFCLLCSVQTSHLVQKLTDLLPVVRLTIINDMVPPPTALNYLPQAWVFFPQVLLWKKI